MISCSSNENKQIKSNPTETTGSAVNSRIVIPFEPDSLNGSSNIAHYLIGKFNKEYEGLKG